MRSILAGTMPDAATTATATTATTGSTGGDGGAVTAGAQQAGAATQANGQAAGAGATSAATNQAAGATGKTANATLITGEAKGDQKPDANATTQTGDKKDGEAKGDKPFELKLPDGAQLDAEAVKAVAADLQKLGLSQDLAQKVFERELSAVRKNVETSRDRWAKQTQQWAEAVKTDKEIGGDKLKATIDVAKRALAHADDEKGTLRQLLEETGLGNHPAVIRAFHKLGRDMGEDDFAGKKEQGQGTDEEAALRKRYPTMFPNG